MIRPLLAAAVFGLFLLVGAAAMAQVVAPSPAPTVRYVAHARVSVANDALTPETVTGTGIQPFQLAPHEQAQIDMQVVPPPAPVPTNDGKVPVRFEFNVGQGGGPRCSGHIDMELHGSSSQNQSFEVTNCVAHSLGTNGAGCQIAVDAKSGECQGALAFTAP